jgi:pimeloyl-ACP methyl ester carboxylesterase
VSATWVREVVGTSVGAIEVFRAGPSDGLPVVYLHSMIAEGPGMAVLESLAEQGYLVVAPMLPGFGESQGLEEIEDVEDMAFLILELLDGPGLGLGRGRCPRVMGHSLGSYLALEVAVRWPDRIGPLVLAAPLGVQVPGHPLAEVFNVGLEGLARLMLADADHPMVTLMRYLAPVVAGRDAPAPGTIESMRPFLRNLWATSKLAFSPYFFDLKLIRRLHRISGSVTLVRGQLDSFVPAEVVAAIANGINAGRAGADLPPARVLAVEGAGHLVLMDRPEAALAALRATL